MKEAAATFQRLRPRLQGLAYRMLGSLAEAEDVVQDAWLRWHDVHAGMQADTLAGTAANAPDNPEAWLVTVTTRLAIDRLRAAKVQREHYAGIWLPEPVLTDSPGTPEELLAFSHDVSVAFLLLLERLAPEARAAFLLREVLDVDYADVAQALGKSEAACRQIVHRAKAQLRGGSPRYPVSPDTHERLLRSFADAVSRGDFSALNTLLADDAELMGDGGGKVTSFPEPLRGGQRIAQLFYAAHRRLGDGTRVELAHLNGQWALLRFMEGALESALSFETDGERILRIHVQRNPDKLARLVTALGER